jgi:hypothetical protein
MHRHLRAIWLQDVGWYSSLSPSEQWHLHDYFKPATDLSDKALLDHRRQVTQGRPSLPQQAGRALAEMQQGRAPVPVTRQVTTPTKRGKVRQVSVRSVVRPQPDFHKPARALLARAVQQAEEELAAREADGRPHGDASTGADVLDGGLGEVELGSDPPDGKT